MRTCNRKGRSFVTIMIVIALGALAVRIAIEQIMRRTIVQNEDNAITTLKLFSASFESFAKNNRGVFPDTLAQLTSADPPYLDKSYVAQSPIKGYAFSCPRLEPSNYGCVAVPARCGLTGKKVYSISTGGTVTSDECSKKE